MVLLLIGAIAIANLTKPPLPIEPGPTPTPSPTSPPMTTTPATPGAGELADATIAMPFLLKQACPSTPLPYRGGTYEGDVPFQWFAHVTATARTDVDRDGVEEVIVRADCSVSDDTQNQIIALRPDGNGWATLGVVVEPTSAGPGAIQRSATSR